jgi:hypothetical protein
MRDIREALREKELQRQAIQREVEALRLAVALLNEEGDSTKPPERVQIRWKDARTWSARKSLAITTVLAGP